MTLCIYTTKNTTVWRSFFFLYVLHFSYLVAQMFSQPIPCNKCPAGQPRGPAKMHPLCYLLVTFPKPFGGTISPFFGSVTPPGSARSAATWSHEVHSDGCFQTDFLCIHSISNLYFLQPLAWQYSWHNAFIETAWSSSTATSSRDIFCQGISSRDMQPQSPSLALERASVPNPKSENPALKGGGPNPIETPNSAGEKRLTHEPVFRGLNPDIQPWLQRYTRIWAIPTRRCYNTTCVEKDGPI